MKIYQLNRYQTISSPIIMFVKMCNNVY